MPVNPTLELTPLIEELLSIVQETCRPSANDWQTKFVDRICVTFYTPPNSGELITAEDAVKRDMRLLAVERAASARQRRTKETTVRNFTK